MVDLDAVIRRARSATVRRDAAEAYVRDFERSTRGDETERAASRSLDALESLPSPASPDSPNSHGSRWVPWSRGSHRPDESHRPRWVVPLIAAAAAAVIAVAIGLALVAHDDAPRPLAAVRIGERVAIVAEPGTVYRIVRAGADDTAIEVERGEVTARLWPGTRAHRLTLQGGGVVALAQGTVYSLAVERGTGAVQVDEGTVEVHVGAEVHRVPAGTSWPPDRPRPRGRDRASVLTALATPTRKSPTSLPAPAPAPAPSPAPASSPSADVAIAADPPRTPLDRVTLDATPPRRASPDLKATPSSAIKARWQLARRLRGEGKVRLAIAECIAIADLHDATWSPIALVEAIRLYAGPLADPAHAMVIADRVIAEWPGDVLVPEARQLRCRALARLGRGQECDVPPLP